MLTQEQLKRLLHYNPETGVFTWLVKRGRQAAGYRAGTLNKHWGYYYICIDRRLYRRNRLAWFYTYGEWPKYDVDHIDGVTTNDAISNLRDVTRSQNMQNRKGAQSNSRSGILGVHQYRNGRWRAQIKGTGTPNQYLGEFDTPEEARAAYLEAKRSIHI